jgi:hypothetical protein
MAGHQDFSAPRWASVILRSLHLAGVVLVGTELFAGDTPALAGVALTVLTGLALYGVELWRHPDLWKEVAGLFMPVKLVMLLAVLLVPNGSGTVFWIVLVSSSVISHAPLTFRRKKLIG